MRSGGGSLLVGRSLARASLGRDPEFSILDRSFPIHHFQITY